MFADALQHSFSFATATRTEFWPCCKKGQRATQDNHFTNLVDIAFLLEIQPQIFLSSEEENLVFLTYMGMTAILFNSVEPFEQIDNTISTEDPMWKLVKLVKQFQRRRLNITRFYKHIAMGKGRSPLGDYTLIVIKNIYYLNHTS